MTDREKNGRKNDKGIRKHLTLIVVLFSVVGSVVVAIGWMDRNYVRAETYEIQQQLIVEQVAGIKSDIAWLRLLALTERIESLVIRNTAAPNSTTRKELIRLSVQKRRLENQLGVE